MLVHYITQLYYVLFFIAKIFKEIEKNNDSINFFNLPEFILIPLPILFILVIYYYTKDVICDLTIDNKNLVFTGSLSEFKSLAILYVLSELFSEYLTTKLSVLFSISSPKAIELVFITFLSRIPSIYIEYKLLKKLTSKVKIGDYFLSYTASSIRYITFYLVIHLASPVIIFLPLILFFFIRNLTIEALDHKQYSLKLNVSLKNITSFYIESLKNTLIILTVIGSPFALINYNRWLIKKLEIH